MIDHIFLPVTDLDRSQKFYSAMLAPLGNAEPWEFKAQAGFPDLYGFGPPGVPGFWLKLIPNVVPDKDLYVAFATKSKEEVDKAYAAALANGGTDNGGPGPRPQFHPDYYAANVLDPDGYSLEINFKPWLHV